MKANEFVKKFGWNEAKEALKRVIWCETAYCSMLGHGCFKSNSDCCVDINDLKRLIESHELVKEHGSLGGAKEYADSVYTAPEVAERLHAAIADVESCMEGL